MVMKVSLRLCGIFVWYVCESNWIVVLTCGRLPGGIKFIQCSSFGMVLQLNLVSR